MLEKYQGPKHVGYKLSLLVVMQIHQSIFVKTVIKLKAADFKKKPMFYTQ